MKSGPQLAAVAAILLLAAPQVWGGVALPSIALAPAKPSWRFANLLARSLAGVPISTCGGKLRLTAPAHGPGQFLDRCAVSPSPCARGTSASLHVIASIEEPGLIAKILGHVRACDAAVVTDARAPPGDMQEAFRLN